MAEAFGISERYVRQIVRRYKENDPNGIKEKERRRLREMGIYDYKGGIKMKYILVLCLLLGSVSSVYSWSAWDNRLYDKVFEGCLETYEEYIYWRSRHGESGHVVKRLKQTFNQQCTYKGVEVGDWKSRFTVKELKRAGKF